MAAKIRSPLSKSICAAIRMTGHRRADSGLAADRSPVGGLAMRFPVTPRVVGDESFDAMARRFIVSEPTGHCAQLRPVARTDHSGSHRRRDRHHAKVRYRDDQSQVLDRSHVVIGFGSTLSFSGVPD